MCKLKIFLKLVWKSLIVNEQLLVYPCVYVFHLIKFCTKHALKWAATHIHCVLQIYKNTKLKLLFRAWRTNFFTDLVFCNFQKFLNIFILFRSPVFQKNINQINGSSNYNANNSCIYITTFSSVIGSQQKCILFPSLYSRKFRI